MAEEIDSASILNRLNKLENDFEKISSTLKEAKNTLLAEKERWDKQTNLVTMESNESSLTVHLKRKNLADMIEIAKLSILKEDFCNEIEAIFEEREEYFERIFKKVKEAQLTLMLKRIDINEWKQVFDDNYSETEPGVSSFTLEEFSQFLTDLERMTRDFIQDLSESFRKEKEQHYREKERVKKELKCANENYLECAIKEEEKWREYFEKIIKDDELLSAQNRKIEGLRQKLRELRNAQEQTEVLELQSVNGKRNFGSLLTNNEEKFVKKSVSGKNLNNGKENIEILYVRDDQDLGGLDQVMKKIKQ